ncbi:MAG: GAF domain-containing protein, partial [Bacteroidota bacterium]
MGSPTFDPTQIESPFKVTLSFKKLIANVREMISTGDNPIIARGMDDFLGHINHLDALTGSIAVAEYDEYIDDIELLLCLLFPHPLTHNEIKAATPPIQPDILYRSERFTKVFGEVSKLIPKEFDSMDEDRIYILMCNYLLQSWYGINMYASRSPVYDVVDTQGITRHYKSTYNVDFVDIIPPANPPTMSPELIQQLKHDFDNVRLWKEIFPPGSWELSGFGIRSFVDVSGEEALSRLKNLLIDQRAMQKAKDAERIMNPLFRTLIGIPDLEATFTRFDQSRGVFLRPSDDKPSISLGNMVECSSDTLLCSASSSRVFAERKPFFVQNVDQLPPEAAEITIHRHVMDQGYKSYVLVPVHFEDEMLGVLEF